MRLTANAAIIALSGLLATGCAGGGEGPGYLFQIIFIVLPMLGLVILLIKMV